MKRNSTLRVLVLCYEYPPVGGGGGRVAATIARGLAARGHAVRVLTSRVKGLLREEVVDGISVRRAFAGRRALDHCTVPEMAAYIGCHVGPAVAEVKRFRPDVLHAHFALPTGVVAWAASTVTGVPYVVTAHLGDVPGGVPEQTKHLYRLIGSLPSVIWRSAKASTAVASHVADLAAKAYGIRPIVITNGVSMAGRVIPKARAVVEPVRAVWVGRIQEQKNLGPALESLAPLSGRPWALEVIGDGPLRGDAEKRVYRAGLTEHVTFRGWLDADQVQAALARADLLFLPSLSEGLSVVTVEALRAGLAFVASHIPGVLDVVDQSNGLLCDPSNSAGFAEAFAVLINDRERLLGLRQGSAARAPLFDSERMIDAYERVLSSAARQVRV